MSEFPEVFTQIQNDSQAKSIVLISEKTDNFIAGADIGYVLDQQLS